MILATRDADSDDPHSPDDRPPCRLRLAQDSPADADGRIRRASLPATPPHRPRNVCFAAIELPQHAMDHDRLNGYYAANRRQKREADALAERLRLNMEWAAGKIRAENERRAA